MSFKQRLVKISLIEDETSRMRLLKVPVSVLTQQRWCFREGWVPSSPPPRFGDRGLLFATVIYVFRLHNTGGSARHRAQLWQHVGDIQLPSQGRKIVFHRGVPLSAPGERAGERGRETDRAVTDEGILRLEMNSRIQPWSRFLATIILITSLVPAAGRGCRRQLGDGPILPPVKAMRLCP